MAKELLPYHLQKDIKKMLAKLAYYDDTYRVDWIDIAEDLEKQKQEVKTTIKFVHKLI